MSNFPLKWCNGNILNLIGLANLFGFSVTWKKLSELFDQPGTSSLTFDKVVKS